MPFGISQSSQHSNGARAHRRSHSRLSLPSLHHLSELTGLPLHLKLENLQRTGSFKERGALNKLLTLSEAERKRGVITASAGNHAQGVAFHAAARGIRAQIVMPLATPQIKVAARAASAPRSSCMAQATTKPVTRRCAAARRGPHLHPSL